MSRKSLLSALSRRARTTETSSSSIPAPVKVAPASTRPRRALFDDKSGPTPPRGSLTREKLSYLDWRLQRINALRTTSERTSDSWIDGRSTIGRNSIDIRQVETAEPAVPAAPEEPVEPVVAVVETAPVETLRFYVDEKEAAKKALIHAMAADSIVASMPRLTKRGSSSGSDHSGSSDQHHEEAPQHTTTAQAEKVSFLRRASRRISMRPPPAHLSSASPMSRIWQRSA